MKTYFYLTVLMIFIVACGTNIDNEERKWAENVQKIKHYTNNYPNLAPLLETELKQAKQLRNEAQEASSEQKKVEKMVEANHIFESGLVGNIENFKKQKENLVQTREILFDMKFTDNQLKEVQAEIDKSYAVMNQVSDILVKKYETRGAAVNKITEAVAKLNAVSLNLKELVEKYKDSEQNQLSKDTTNNQ